MERARYLDYATMIWATWSLSSSPLEDPEGAALLFRIHMTQRRAVDGSALAGVNLVESWPARLLGERTAAMVGPRTRVQTAVNGGPELTIFVP
jgi:hypothetical protein